MITIKVKCTQNLSIYQAPIDKFATYFLIITLSLNISLLVSNWIKIDVQIFQITKSLAKFRIYGIYILFIFKQISIFDNSFLFG